MANKRNIYPLLSLLILLLLAGVRFDMDAKKIKQVHKIETIGRKKSEINERNIRVSVHETIPLDTLGTVFAADSITYAGYDKPVNASRESFHIINQSQTDIKKVGIRITYLDLKDRMLHTRDAEVSCLVPAGETRVTSIPSWDIQRTFYYYLGPEPRRVATPYKVTIETLWVEL